MYAIFEEIFANPLTPHIYLYLVVWFVATPNSTQSLLPNLL